MGFLDPASIVNEIIALSVVLAPLEFFILRNVIVFRTFVTGFVAGFGDPERRKVLFSELAHGVLRAVSERAGSLKGVAVKQENAGLLGAALNSGNLAGIAGAVKGKIDLPVVGKVTLSEALQIFESMKGLLGGGFKLGGGGAMTTANTDLK